MSNLNNVSLWFARSDEGEIITIDKIQDRYDGKYHCPLCGSEVIPKAMDSDCVSPHFAHIDRSKCSGESMVHWWVKNELIKVNDVFEVETDVVKQYMCKNIDFEKSFDTPNGRYKPDIVVETYCGETVFIEINFTNSKKAEEYWAKWEHLNNTVVEFKIMGLSYDEEEIDTNLSYKAIYYKNKELNIHNDEEYIKTKRSIIRDKHKGILDKVEWFIKDVYFYNRGLKDIEKIENGFVEIYKQGEKYREFLVDMYKNNICTKAIRDILEFRESKINKIISNSTAKDYIKTLNLWSGNHFINDRLFGNPTIELKVDVASIFKNNKNIIKKIMLKENCNYVLKTNMNSIIINGIELEYSKDIKINKDSSRCVNKNVKLNLTEYEDICQKFIDEINIDYVLDNEVLEQIKNVINIIKNYKNYNKLRNEVLLLVKENESLNSIINKYNKYRQCSTHSYYNLYEKVEKILKDEFDTAFLSGEGDVLEFSKVEYINIFNKDIDCIVDIVETSIKNELYPFEHIVDKCEILKDTGLVTFIEFISYLQIIFKYKNYSFECNLETNSLKINDINICNLEIDDKNKVSNKLKEIIAIVKGGSLYEDNMLSIYNRISNVYNNITNNYYDITIDYGDVQIRRKNNVICKTRFNIDTTYKDVISKFSNAVRSYLYGGSN